MGGIAIADIVKTTLGPKGMVCTLYTYNIKEPSFPCVVIFFDYISCCIKEFMYNAIVGTSPFYIISLG